MKVTKNNKFKNGFTLVELVVVIAIIAILGSVSIVGYYGFVNKGHKSVLESEANQIKQVIFIGVADPDSGFKYNTLKDKVLVTDESYYQKSGLDIDPVRNYYINMTGDDDVTLSECDSSDGIEARNPSDRSMRYIKYSNDKGFAVITIETGEVTVTLNK